MSGLAPVAPRPAVTGAGQTSREVAATIVESAPAAPPAAASPAATAVPGIGDPAVTPDPAADPAANVENDPRFAPKFAALARKERLVQERESKVKAFETEVAAYQKSKADAKLDPLALLRAHGWEYDTLTQFVLNDSKLTDAQKLKILEEEQAVSKAATTEAEAAAKRAHAEKAETSHKEALKAFIDANPETYELVRSQDAYDLVYDVQASHYQKTFNKEINSGEILGFDQAAKMVEEYLEANAKKILATKKFGQVVPVGDPGTQQSATTPQSRSPTLTNRMHGTATPSPAAGKMLDDEASKREAAKLLKFT